MQISTVDLTGTTLDKSTVEISKTIVAFSEYMNFTLWHYRLQDQGYKEREVFA